MAFPTTGIIDDFQRANELPIGGDWTTPMYSGESAGPDLFNNQADFQAGSAYYNVSQFGPDVEVYLTVITKPGFGEISIRARAQNVGAASGSYYDLQWWASNEYFIRKVISGTPTTLSTATRSFAAGDKMGLEILGEDISFYHFSSGSWALVTSVTDSDITSAGYLAMESNDGGCDVDDFGGGSLVADTGLAWIRA